MTWTRVHAQEEMSSLLPRLQGNSHKLNDLRQDLFEDELPAGVSKHLFFGDASCGLSHPGLLGKSA